MKSPSAFFQTRTLRRWIYFLGGLALTFTSWFENQSPGIWIGLGFCLMALANAGCAGGTCSPQARNAAFTKTKVGVDFEEVL